MKTRFTTLFGVSFPLMSGGMMWISKAPLVAAVANAGGLGVLTALSHPDPEAFRKEIQATRALTAQPFGVNLTLLPTLKPVPYERYLQVALEEGIDIVETAGRSPEPFMPLLKAKKVKVIHKCTSLRHALKAEALGCDAVSIDGFECAGHPGEEDIGGLVLIPRVTKALQIPVIASGGFADGRGLVAALALGSEGINMGTRFLLTKEAPLNEELKQKLANAQENETSLIFRSLKNSARVYDNEQAQAILRLEAAGKGIEEIAPLASGLRGFKAYQSGDDQHAVLTLGQVVGLIDDIPSVEELIQRIMKEAKSLIQERLTRLL